MVRLSEDERAAWHTAARAAGWGKTAGWVRSVVAAAVTGRGASTSTSAAAPATSRAVDREVLRELAQIGSNVNQLARAVNVAAHGGQPLAVEAAAVEALRMDVVRLQAVVAAASSAGAAASSAGAAR